VEIYGVLFALFLASHLYDRSEKFKWQKDCFEKRVSVPNFSNITFFVFCQVLFADWKRTVQSSSDLS